MIQRQSVVHLFLVGTELVQTARWESERSKDTKRALKRLKAVFETDPLVVLRRLGGGVQDQVLQQVSIIFGRGVWLSLRDLKWT